MGSAAGAPPPPPRELLLAGGLGAAAAAARTGEVGVRHAADRELLLLQKPAQPGPASPPRAPL